MVDTKIEQDINMIINTIGAVRNIKANLNISPSKNINMHIRGQASNTDSIQNNMELMNRMIKLENLKVGKNLEKPEQSATAVVGNVEIFIPLKGLIDIDKEISRLEKQASDMNGRLSAVSKKLENKNFIDRAPKDIIEHEKNKQADYQQKLDKLKDNLHSLMK
jgi:valyl-tRNA synthetase